MILNPLTLTALRKSKAITKSELAAEAEVSLSYLSEIESGYKVPSEAIVRRLAAALYVNPHALVKDPPETKKRKAKAAS